nr:hypothetical protein SYMBAF_90109 [Serratia symbiotica]
MKRAVVIFSGGQDSTTCLIQALQQYDEVHCVTFDYGQRHHAEIAVAQELSLTLGAKAHKVLDVGLLNELAISSLTRDNIPVPAYVCHECTLWQIRVQCCARDEGRPLGGGVQMQPSNYPELLPLRAVVVSVREKAQSDASCMCCEDERE